MNETLRKLLKLKTPAKIGVTAATILVVGLLFYQLLYSDVADDIKKAKAQQSELRGEGVEGLSYQLNAEQHVVGKAGQLVFPDDPFVSPKHANFFYRNGTLCVKDEVVLSLYVTVNVCDG